jgi:hypothetical protein
MEHAVFASVKPATLLCYPLASAYGRRADRAGLMRIIEITDGPNEWQFAQLMDHARASLAANPRGERTPRGRRRTTLARIPAAQVTEAPKVTERLSYDVKSDGIPFLGSEMSQAFTPLVDRTPDDSEITVGCPLFLVPVIGTPTRL